MEIEYKKKEKFKMSEIKNNYFDNDDVTEENEEREKEEVELIYAENDADDLEQQADANNYDKKLEELEKTRITKQIWSVSEINSKLRNNELNLEPFYQRNSVWTGDKQTAFIESLFMGISVPPIYVVEIASDDPLSDVKYEVVDGKQRLLTIQRFLKGELKLKKSALEYFGNQFAGKNYNEIIEIDRHRATEFASFVMDVYVITANSPEATRFDIFSRLNRGAEPLRVNEIRRAVYSSDTLRSIDDYIRLSREDTEWNNKYNKIYSNVIKKRYGDLGRIYRSIAYFVKTDKDKQIVEGYNSRPKEMINQVLNEIQKGRITIEQQTIKKIIDGSIELLYCFNKNKEKDLLVDTLIPYVEYNIDIIEVAEKLMTNEEYINTTKKSSSTTSNVNERARITAEIIKESKG